MLLFQKNVILFMVTKIANKIDKKLILITAFSISWPLLTLFTKLGLNDGANSIALTIQTLALASVILTIYLLITNKKVFSQLKPPQLKDLLIIAIFVSVGWISALKGLSLSTSINYNFLLSAGTVSTLIFAAIFLNEKFTRNKTVYTFLLLYGTYLIATGGQTIIPNIGDILIICAAVFFSAAIILQKKLINSLDSSLVGLGRIAASVLFLAPVAKFIFHTPLVIKSPQFLILASVSLALTTVFMNQSLKYSTVSYFSMMSMMAPVIGTILGGLFLHESLNFVQLMGGVIIIISGVMIHQTKVANK